MYTQTAPCLSSPTRPSSHNKDHGERQPAGVKHVKESASFTFTSSTLKRRFRAYNWLLHNMGTATFVVRAFHTFIGVLASNAISSTSI
ncbi:hypothetical protein LY78DRAFT_468895 [Colletotrichum sublineola]|nr:hypothetical protein LY78DRAFT_468895 [Colletotrichum sublineola]